MANLSKLTKEDLVQILTGPKNALVKQYQQLLAMDDVTLEFSSDALDAIAQKALDRKTGARGLRSIIEESMLDVMFEIPERDDVSKVIITEETVNENAKPELLDADDNHLEG